VRGSPVAGDRPPTLRACCTQRTAAAWAALMYRLGYHRHGAAGNDAGSMISPQVGRIDPEHVVGVHVTQVFSFPTGDPAEFEGMSAEDGAAMGKLQWFMDHKISFTSCTRSSRRRWRTRSPTPPWACSPGTPSS
jgi:epoxide hydrolase